MALPSGTAGVVRGTKAGLLLVSKSGALESWHPRARPSCSEVSARSLPEQGSPRTVTWPRSAATAVRAKQLPASSTRLSDTRPAPP